MAGKDLTTPWRGLGALPETEEEGFISDDNEDTYLQSLTAGQGNFARLLAQAGGLKRPAKASDSGDVTDTIERDMSVDPTMNLGVRAKPPPQPTMDDDNLVVAEAYRFDLEMAEERLEEAKKREDKLTAELANCHEVLKQSTMATERLKAAQEKELRDAQKEAEDQRRRLMSLIMSLQLPQTSGKETTARSTVPKTSTPVQRSTGAPPQFTLPKQPTADATRVMAATRHHLSLSHDGTAADPAADTIPLHRTVSRAPAETAAPGGLHVPLSAAADGGAAALGLTETREDMVSRAVLEGQRALLEGITPLLERTMPPPPPTPAVALEKPEIFTGRPEDSWTSWRAEFERYLDFSDVPMNSRQAAMILTGRLKGEAKEVYNGLIRSKQDNCLASLEALEGQFGGEAEHEKGHALLASVHLEATDTADSFLRRFTSAFRRANPGVLFDINAPNYSWVNEFVGSLGEEDAVYHVEGQSPRCVRDATRALNGFIRAQKTKVRNINEMHKMVKRKVSGTPICELYEDMIPNSALAAVAKMDNKSPTTQGAAQGPTQDTQGTPARRQLTEAQRQAAMERIAKWKQIYYLPYFGQGGCWICGEKGHPLVKCPQKEASARRKQQMDAQAAMSASLPPPPPNLDALDHDGGNESNPLPPQNLISLA